jgi:protoporphyrinogen oxidase
MRAGLDARSGERCVIVGAGPAGLTAGLEAQRLGIPAVVLERDEVVGGISRTVFHRGYRFDLGGHRFFTKVAEVQALWSEILGADLLTRQRLSRIYYEDRFFDYPIKPLNALRGLGPVEALRIVLSYAAARLFPSPEERSFEQWVSKRFGRRLYEIFFKTYTEKVWGLPCSEIGSDWAAQRIKNLDMVAAIKNALLGSGTRRGEIVTTLIDQFAYPRLGPGMLWERTREILEAKGVPVRLGHEVVRVRHDGRRVLALEVRDRMGRTTRVEGAQFLSSMPIRDLFGALDPAPPPDVLAAARRLRYRDFLTVALVVDRAELFPDQWIYIHSPNVRVGRIQNFKNWSSAMVPDPGKTSLGLEYFVQEGDELWSASDAALVELARREVEQLGLARAADVIDAVVMRVPKAYPVYDHDHREALAILRGYLDGFANLQLVGRNGQHHYNNQDHSMLTALYAVRNLAGGAFDVWDVNVEGSYHEEVRLAPGVASRRVDEEAIRQAFARYDPGALGGALAVVLGVAAFLASAVPFLRGSEAIAPALALSGAGLALVEAAIAGLGLGVGLAWTINAVIGWHEAVFRREVELARSLEALDREQPRP